MLPSTGYFKGFNCPFYESGLCERPYCHFRHAKKEISESNEPFENGEILQQLVSEAVKKVLLHSESNLGDSDRGVNSQTLITKVVQELTPATNNKSVSSSTTKVTYNPTPISELNRCLPTTNEFVPAPSRKEYLNRKHIPVPYTPHRPSRSHGVRLATKSDVFISLAVRNDETKYTPTGMGCESSVKYLPGSLTAHKPAPYSPMSTSGESKQHGDSKSNSYTPTDKANIGEISNVSLYTPSGCTRVSGVTYSPGAAVSADYSTSSYCPTNTSYSANSIGSKSPCYTSSLTYLPTPLSKNLNPKFSSDEEDEPNTKRARVSKGDCEELEDLDSEFEILGQILDDENDAKKSQAALTAITSNNEDITPKDIEDRLKLVTKLDSTISNKNHTKLKPSSSKISSSSKENSKKHSKSENLKKSEHKSDSSKSEHKSSNSKSEHKSDNSKSEKSSNSKSEQKSDNSKSENKSSNSKSEQKSDNSKSENKSSNSKSEHKSDKHSSKTHKTSKSSHRESEKTFSKNESKVISKKEVDKHQSSKKRDDGRTISKDKDKKSASENKNRNSSSKSDTKSSDSKNRHEHKSSKLSHSSSSSKSKNNESKKSTDKDHKSRSSSKHNSTNEVSKKSSKDKECKRDKEKEKHKSKDKASVSNSPAPDDVASDTELIEELSDSDEERITQECMRIFEEYVPTAKEVVNPPNSTKQTIGDAVPVNKKRVAHLTNQTIYRAPTTVLPDHKGKAVQLATDRYSKVRQFHESRKRPSTESVQSQFLFQQDEPSPSPTVSSSKVRIAHVPNVSTMLYAKKSIPKVPEAAPKSTTVQTVTKGASRVAHMPNEKFCDRPGVLEPLASKIPVNIRSRYLNLMIDECLKIYLTAEDAYNRAQQEELYTNKKCTAVPIYKNSAILSISRLRKEVQEAGGNKINISDAGTSTLSHNKVLLGKLADSTSWSIENKYKKDDFSKELSGLRFYENISKWVLTEEELRDNGFPRPHPENKDKGLAKIFTVNTRQKKQKGFIRLCCRCKKEYQVDKKGTAIRKEECIYHPNNKYRFRGEVKYQCCGQDTSSDGCLSAMCHVYEYVDHDNLRGFVKTLPKENLSNDQDYRVYALDCEMCYTSNGLDLTRVTVIDCNLKVVYESLVKPLYPIIDYNTRYSGLTEEDMKDVKTTLLEVQATFLHMFSDKTILVGHSLESDFKALKLIHDTVVDTSVLFPHKMGPPYKRALRNLTSEYLKKIIQNSLDGHDSAEDATVCMELLIWKLKEELKTR